MIAVTAHRLDEVLAAFECRLPHQVPISILDALAAAQKAWPEHSYQLGVWFENGDYGAKRDGSVWFWASEAGAELAGLA